jgi:hypothetical protein
MRRHDQNRAAGCMPRGLFETSRLIWVVNVMDFEKRAKTVVLVPTGGHASSPKHGPTGRTWQFPAAFSRRSFDVWSMKYPIKRIPN